MFETLNDRGLKASQADLLKNHLLSYAGDRIREAQQKWAQMMGVIESLDEPDMTVTYLHHWLITKFGPTKERDVFDKVKAVVNSQARSIEFLDELADGAHDYAALLNPEHRKWNDYGTSTRKHVSIIRRDLKVYQIRPLMFAVARRFSVKEAKLAFRLFVFCSVRFLIAGGRGGFLERNYGLIAQEVGTGKLKTAAELSDAIEKIAPSDALFEAAFAEARVSQNYLARYYLRSLELSAKLDPEPELVPNEEQVINLEHVLPENPDAGEWPGIDPETAEAYYRRIGNMVLLQATRNSIIGNSSFAKKKEVLKDSAFILTAQVADYAAWGLEQIVTRQKLLARMAVATWPLRVA
jgi:hypothetical protein